jgi:hypothetical protein
MSELDRLQQMNERLEAENRALRELAQYLLWQRDRGGPVADCVEAWNALRAAVQEGELSPTTAPASPSAP